MFTIVSSRWALGVVAFVLSCNSNCFVGTAHSQVISEAASEVITSTVTPRQRLWLDASVNERLLLAEEIGEEGGRAFAHGKSWAPVYDGTEGAMIHGPDQVYRGADGTVHVIEAKGGSSQLGKGYGYSQGSSEWAVQSAKRVLGSPAATDVEQQGARAIIEAASQGKLEVHVVRTTHVLGEPQVAKLENSVKCSGRATELAQEATTATVQHASRTLGKVAQASDDAVRCADDVARSADDAVRATAGASGVGAGYATALGVAGIAIDAGLRVADGIETERKYEVGIISGRERAIAHGQNAGGMAGGMAGAYVGVDSGAAAGAAIGTFFCPGFGTAIGAFFGGLAGGVGGYAAGDAVGAGITGGVIDASYGY